MWQRGFQFQFCRIPMLVSRRGQVDDRLTVRTNRILPTLTYNIYEVQQTWYREKTFSQDYPLLLFNISN